MSKKSEDEILSEIVDKLVVVNNLKYNMLKVVEEATETNELLIKYITKQKDLKPTEEQIAEEVGDLIARIMVLVTHLDIETQVANRVFSKLELLDKAIENGTLGTKLKIKSKNNK